MLKICNYPGCNLFTKTTYCEDHQEEYNEKRRERLRGKKRIRKKTPWSRWYWTNTWKKLSKQFLRENPKCCKCAEPSTEVDHIFSWDRSGDFWDYANWQAMCKSCHAKKTNSERSEGSVGLSGHPRLY